MDFLPQNIQDYAEAHTVPESDMLNEINRDTYANVLMPRMLSGHIQGRILSTFSHMIKPETILEIGTYTGYSAICLAEGLQDNGRLITIDINEELESRVRENFTKAGVENKIEYHIGNAMDIIPELEFTFDMVFIDADKENYSNYFDLVFDKVSKGGFIIADNVLWSGKVTESEQDKDTAALVQFNKKVHEDDRIENVLFPVRDGLMVLRKK